MSATDYSKHKRIVIVERGRIRGELVVLMGAKAWVSPLDLTIWDEDRRSGRVLYSNDFSASIVNGVCDLPEHMIRSDVRDDVLDVLDEMKAACVAAVEALAPVVSEEPDWEYGVVRHDGVMVNNGDYMIQQTHRRRKAGPWVPVPSSVQQEGTEE